MIKANATVTEILLVTLTPNGVKPSILINQTKKNTVSKYGIYFLYFFSPILGIAISSLMYITIGSKKRPAPFAIPLLFAYEFAKIAGFRNFLAHDYEKIDHNIICSAILPKVNDTKTFIEQIKLSLNI